MSGKGLFGPRLYANSSNNVVNENKLCTTG
jgi:hypothetical protein